MAKLILCRPKSLPADRLIQAAQRATAVNPANAPDIEHLMRTRPGFQPTPLRIAIVTKKYWGKKGVHLTVGFLDNPSTELRKRIIQHLNAWSKTANVKFVASQIDPQVRIARVKDDGYWSYLGTDILSEEPDLPTMNLEGFTMKTREEEFRRVVRHEAGHTLGFDHEHLRQELVSKIDPDKAIAYFKKSDGWVEQTTREQVLIPLEQSSIRGTTVDPFSIMCYDIPGEITHDGEPIVGGSDINPTDYKFAGKIYPKKPKAKPKANKKAAKKPRAKRPPAAKRK